MSNKNNSGPKDVFLYLLSIITLYLTAISFGTLLYQIINIYIPDSLSQGRYFNPNHYLSPLRWAIASLIIVFPVYIWIMNYLKKDYIKYPKKLQLKTRKWLLALTLFIAAVVIIGDLIAVIFRYLEGDISTRFGLKVLVILTISSSIFYYYLWQLRNQPHTKNILKTIFSYLAITVVIFTTIYGFTLAGSPQVQRLKKLDQRRITNLQNIQWQIINYWQKKDKLPEQLDQLEDDISGYQVPADPVTNQVYQYRKTENLEFQLCANFDTQGTDYNTVPVPRAVIPEKSSQNWDHAIGNVCFTRTIDPDLYKTPPPQLIR